MIEVFINNLSYDTFKKIRVTKTRNGIAGSFEFTTVTNDLVSTDINLYDEVRIKIDGDWIINGYIDPIATAYDEDTHELTVAGHDKTKDIVQCSVSRNTQYKGPMFFEKFCEKVLFDNALTDFTVINEGVEAFVEEGETISSQTGKPVFEFIDEIARKKGVLLSSDGFANIVMFRNPNKISNIVINNKKGQGNNVIKDGSISYDMNNRFSQIIVLSQGGADGFSSVARAVIDAESVEGFAIDPDVKRSRLKVIISKTATDVVGCKKQAIWEVNKRRADSVKYSIKVRDHSAPSEGYLPGKKIIIKDDFVDIASIMLIDSTEWVQTLTSKSATLTLVHNDAYKIQATDPTKFINKVGENIKGSAKLNVVEFQDFIKQTETL